MFILHCKLKHIIAHFKGRQDSPYDLKLEAGFTLEAGFSLRLEAEVTERACRSWWRVMSSLGCGEQAGS